MAETRISFSTLACPNCTVPQIVDAAVEARYHGIELRFVEGEDSLWKLPAFQGAGLRDALNRISDAGLAISCLDTSCRFDSPDVSERDRWIEEGLRMADLAAALRAPGIRVFGDRVPPGVEREMTGEWVHDSMSSLAERVAQFGVEVWLETHGDFSRAGDVLPALPQRNGVGLVWDAVSAFVECGERPLQHGTALQTLIRHVHIKDLRNENGKWIPALIGEGVFPLAGIRAALKAFNYTGFLSFEWEKKWHPEIEPPEVAIPHFANWFRERWQVLDETGILSGAHD